MKFILGYKKEMTQTFKEDGRLVPVTKIQAGPCIVSQLKNSEKDGYTGVQIAFDTTKKLNKAKAGHLKDMQFNKHVAEFRSATENFTKGQTIDVSIFAVGDKVHVTGTVKGRGFQGVVKRHGFGGGKKSHGHKDQLRMPGSIGAGGMQKVSKGRRMGGQMGNTPQTVRNLEIISIDKEKNIIAVKGAVPGARNGLLRIATTK